MTFVSKSSVGPSYVANGQEDHKTYTNLNDDIVIMTNYCYFETMLTFMGLNEKKEKEEKEHGETIKGPPSGRGLIYAYAYVS